MLATASVARADEEPAPPAESGEKPAKSAAKPSTVGGHVGIATPYLSVSKKVNVIGKDDFLTIANPVGVTVRTGGRWAFDFEVIVSTSVLRREATGLIIDPGVIYNFGPFAAGLRAAYQIGESSNFGAIPLINKGFNLGAVTWFVEAAFPTFVKSGEVTFNAVAHTGLAF